MASGDTRKVILKNTDGEILIPYTEVASSTTAGRVKPDGTTTSVDSTGAMSVIGKQDTLVSGTNIKTVNGNSLLGSGNIPISAQVSYGNITGTLSDQTDLQDALDAKQGTLTFDSTPTSGSSNPVTSGGIYNAILNQAAFANITGQPSDNTNLATALNSKANNSDVVKLTGNQTVAGEKTFSNNIFANADIVVNKNVALGSNSQTLCLSACTNNNKLASLFQGWAETARNTTGMYAFNSSGGYEGVAVSIDENGNKATYAPTPTTTDNSTKIATTAFVNNKFQVVTALPASPTAGVFYFVKE